MRIYVIFTLHFILAKIVINAHIYWAQRVVDQTLSKATFHLLERTVDIYPPLHLLLDYVTMCSSVIIEAQVIVVGNLRDLMGGIGSCCCNRQ